MAENKLLNHLGEEQVHTYIIILSPRTLFLEIISIFSTSFYNVPLLGSIFQEGEVHAEFNSWGRGWISQSLTYTAVVLRITVT